MDPEIEIATLHYGEYFGEASLLTRAPRNASVYASADEVVLSVLSKEQFESHNLRGKMDLQIKYAELNNGLGNAAKAFTSCKNFIKLVIALGRGEIH